MPVTKYSFRLRLGKLGPVVNETHGARPAPSAPPARMSVPVPGKPLTAERGSSYDHGTNIRFGPPGGLADGVRCGLRKQSRADQARLPVRLPSASRLPPGDAGGPDPA